MNDLAYRLDGRDGEPVLLLSSSLGTTTRLWDPQLDAFASRFRVLRHDHPGHGASPVWYGAVTVGAIASAVLALADELGVGRFSFCGLSLGGMVGMWLAANAPERVDSLVLCCTGAKLGEPQAWSERAALVRRRGTAAVVDATRERWFTPGFRGTDRARTYLDELAAVPAQGYASACEAVGAFDFTDDLHRIQVPTLVLVGDEDPVTPPGVVRALERGISHATTARIRGAAHLANVERPEAVADAVLSHATARAPA